VNPEEVFHQTDAVEVCLDLAPLTAEDDPLFLFVEEIAEIAIDLVLPMPDPPESEGLGPTLALPLHPAQAPVTAHHPVLDHLAPRRGPRDRLLPQDLGLKARESVEGRADDSLSTFRRQILQTAPLHNEVPSH
jgi:hypothetical protein